MIRKGENFSFVEANIFLPESELAIDGNIIVSREVHINGRNACKINGRLVTVNELKEFMKNVIDIHGQNDNQTLLESSSHIMYVDKFVGSDLVEIKEEYSRNFRKYKTLNQELEQNYGNEKEKQRKLDLLRYQLNEIETSNLKLNEDEELGCRRKIMMNSEKIVENINIVENNLSENVIESINLSIRALEKIEDINESYKEKLIQLKDIYYEVQEISRDIGMLKNEDDFDEYERNQIEERLDLIFSLKRKYGNSIEEILQYKKKLEEEIYDIENMEEMNKKRRIEIELITDKMQGLATKIHENREKYSIILANRINKELQELEMKNASFSIKIKEDIQFNNYGRDIIEFLICTNKGEESKPLTKIASGGEMSRIMLAIKTVLADIDEVSTLIFDEIDTGISGKAARAVGEKIKIISRNHQVLCITHSANIAANGDYNYYIYKEVEKELTKTKVKLLEENEVINELARITSGEVTEIALRHAIELRQIAS
ncbi:MAG: DNA repair protein RecN [Clostridia bacterium]|nr:DNA repair protein RecN [Clostridia bacterium]